MNSVARDVIGPMNSYPLRHDIDVGADEAVRNRLADSLLREIAGFHNRKSAPTQRSIRRAPAPAREWLRDTLLVAAEQGLPRGSSIVVGDGRWAACVIGYIGNSQPGVLSFAFWLHTSADSRVCGGASLDLTDESDPYWGFWIQ